MLHLLLALQTAGAPVPALPAPTHYRLSNKSTVEVGGGMAPPIALAMSALVTITATDSGMGRIVHIAVDSSNFDAGQTTAQLRGAVPQMFVSATGATLDLYTVNGAVKRVTPSADIPQLLQLVPPLQLLLAGTRPAKVGDSWVDTTAADTTAAAALTKATLITAWTVKAGSGTNHQLEGKVTGQMSLGAGATQLNMQTAGTSRVVGPPGAFPAEATLSAAGQANMSAGGGVSIPMNISNDISAKMVP